MRKIIGIVLILNLAISQVGAKFMFEETDPYCSLTGITHTSFPGEISDTSSWNIPTVYQGVCDDTPDISNQEKEKIYEVMYNFFDNKDYIGPVYGGTGGYGGSNSLNPSGQEYVNIKFFPAVIKYIERERQKDTPNIKNIALLNAAVKTIGYDYFLQKLQ